jgi:hypothetical protein
MIKRQNQNILNALYKGLLDQSCKDHEDIGIPLSEPADPRILAVFNRISKTEITETALLEQKSVVSQHHR